MRELFKEKRAGEKASRKTIKADNLSASYSSTSAEANRGPAILDNGRNLALAAGITEHLF